MTDTHRCAMGPACRQPDTHNGQRQGATITTQNGVCDPCYAHIESCTHQLVRDWLELRRGLGDSSASTGQRVKSTPTPGIPIAASRSALMTDIVDLADRAASVVADATKLTQPTGRRQAREIAVTNPDGTHITTRPRDNTPAAHAQETAVSESQRLAAHTAFVELHLDALIDADKTDHMIWAKPQRCPKHVEAIAQADQLIADADTRAAQTDAERTAAAVRATTRTCDDCGGWDNTGQAATIVEYDGIDIARQIIDTHNRARAELGKTRLRHRYSLPCPNCHAEAVGRDDGTNVANCTNCESSWTDREYKFLAGLTAEGQERSIDKWLLSEAYARLDHMQALLAALGDLPDGTLLTTHQVGKHFATALAGHIPPEGRKVATDRAAARKREEKDEQWSWAGERPYQKPGRKKPKPTPERKPGPRIAASSLTTLTDVVYLPDATDRRTKPCKNCHTIHRGECTA